MIDLAEIAERTEWTADGDEYGIWITVAERDALVAAVRFSVRIAARAAKVTTDDFLEAHALTDSAPEDR
jgi:hypothetical protein